jgi:hypothetical protein
MIDLTIVHLIHFPKLEETLSVVVILLMFFAVVVMVNNVYNDHEERATRAPIQVKRKIGRGYSGMTIGSTAMR